jgi:hypothetical protein
MAVAACVASVGAVNASMMIGMQWHGDFGTALATSQFAGIVLQNNFNVLSPSTAETSVPLINSQGNPSGVNITYAKFGNNYSTGTGSTTGNDGLLVSSDAKTSGGSGGTTQSFTLNDVPMGNYELIAYTLNNGSTTNGTTVVGQYTATDTQGYSQSYYDLNQQPAAWDSGYSSATGPDWIQGNYSTETAAAAATAQNYVQFVGLDLPVAGSITVTETWAGISTSNGPAFNGFQLILVPEPAALAVVLLGGLGILLLPRRQRAGRPDGLRGAIFAKTTQLQHQGGFHEQTQ